MSVCTPPCAKRTTVASSACCSRIAAARRTTATTSLHSGPPYSAGKLKMIKILIVDDHAIVRAGLKEFLAEVDDMDVAGEACTGEEALAKVRASDWDVVLLDISLPDRSGIDTLKLI